MSNPRCSECMSASIRTLVTGVRVCNRCGHRAAREEWLLVDQRRAEHDARLREELAQTKSTYF